VIGSGSTAATLIPAIASEAAHVTMLQRSPSYFLAPPLTHELAVTLRALDVPEDWTHEILRRAYAAQFNELARMSHEAPDELHAFLMESLKPLLPEGFDVDKHFTPRYRPWQQRITIVPEGDLFAALREGKASIVTDTIETFTRPVSGSAPARSSRLTSSSAPRGSTCRCSETSPSPSTASRSTSPPASPGAGS
jgi:cation diffusion facilitator CzcD-associated flavoprotein CzcO